MMANGDTTDDTTAMPEWFFDIPEQAKLSIWKPFDSNTSYRDWGRCKRKRANRDHKMKKLARKQQRHLRAIKSKAQLRAMVLASRHKR